MAKRITDEVSSCNIILNGLITQTLKSKIVVEIMKYLLYHREQIPLPFDQLDFQYQRQEAGSSGKKQDLFKKRMAQLVRESQELFDEVDALFQDTDVSHLILMFGSTVISPKEVFHIRFVNNEQTAPTLSLKYCMRSVARALITNSPLADSPLPSITNLIVTAHTPRSCTPTWFKPKTNFRVPTAGRRCDIEVHCGMMHTTVSSEDHIWMQAPMGIKGLKDTISQKAPSSLWAS